MKWSPLLIFAICLQANPSGPTVMGGEANFAETNGTLEIATGDRAVIHWDSFSIGAGETTRFIQPAVDSAVLNKVMGAEMSQINGLLQANGQVYLVNPNGVLIGPDGRIDAAAFMATALDIKTGEFLNGEPLALEDSGGIVINLGTIDTKSGPVALIGQRVENGGDIRGSSVSLIAFDATGDHLIFIQPNLGVDILKNTETPSALAVGLGGLVDATAIEIVDGEVYLTGKIDAPGGEVRLLGNSIQLREGAAIDVSSDFQGGTILVGGDYQGKNPEIPNAKTVYCDPKAEVSADALIQGNGGKIIFWGDESMAFHGRANARGGRDGGDGGFVEVSSPRQFAYRGLTCTLAPHGKAGTLLLDPTDFTVSGTLATANATFVSPNYSGTAATATINATDLNNNLALGNVNILGTSGPGASGPITVDADATVSWSANTLTFTNTLAFASTTINGTLNCSGTGTFTVSGADDFILNGTIIYTSNQPLTINSGTHTIDGGTMLLNTSADVTIDTSEFIQIINGSSISNSGTGGISLVCGPGIGLINITDSTLSTNGYISVQNVVPSGANDINVTNSTLTAGTLVFFGNNDASADTTIDSSSITAGSGDISFVAVGNTGEVYLQNNTSLTTLGSGAITFALGVGSQIHLNTNVTLTSASPLTLNAATAVNLRDTINFNIPQPITITSASNNVVIRGGPATINTTSSLLSFPVGVNSSPPFLDRGLTINSVYGSVSFGANSVLSSINATVGGSIDVGAMLDIQLTDLYLNAGSNINLANGSTVQGVGAVALIAGNNIAGSGSGLIQTVNANDLYLVSDNNFPSPTIGSGVFQLGGYTLQTNSGLGGNNIVFLYTSTPNRYIGSSISGFLPSTINGLAHTFGSYTGTSYNKGVNEFLFTYYPNLPVDPPSFELIFKGTGISPASITVIEVAVTEPVSNPPQVAQVTEGNLSTPSTPDPKTPCRTPPVSVQAL